jgi:hypothetical protein
VGQVGAVNLSLGSCPDRWWLVLPGAELDGSAYQGCGCDGARALGPSDGGDARADVRNRTVDNARSRIGICDGAPVRSQMVLGLEQKLLAVRRPDGLPRPALSRSAARSPWGRRESCLCVKGAQMPHSWFSSEGAGRASSNRASTGYSLRGIAIARAARPPLVKAIVPVTGWAHLIAVETIVPSRPSSLPRSSPTPMVGRLLSRRSRASTDAAVRRHPVPRTDVKSRSAATASASRSGRLVAADSSAAATRPGRQHCEPRPGAGRPQGVTAPGACWVPARPLPLQAVPYPVPERPYGFV